MTALAEVTKPSKIMTRKLPPGFGVEIIGMDVPNATPADLAEFDRICKENPVVVIRKQKLDAGQVVELAGRLGRISSQHRTGPHPHYPQISILSNKKVDGKYIGAHEVGRAWHTDGTTYEKLGLVTMLYGVECPAEGSDTIIADTAEAYAALPPAMKEKIENLQAVHSRAKLFKKYSQLGVAPEDIAAMKEVIHPLVITSPMDGKKALFLTKGSFMGIVGMSEEESHALMDELIAFSTQDRFVYAHKWQAEDILIWNDLCTVHKASPYDESKYDRLVYRAWMRPFELVSVTSAAEEMGPAH
jgi:taurine dioxygenase